MRTTQRRFKVPLTRMVIADVFRKTWWRFERFSRTRRADVHLTPEFEKILVRECARAERTGLHFALVIFNITKSLDGHEMQDKLIGLLKKRIRQTDDIGWLIDNRIGLLLYNTNAENAVRFISNLKKSALGAISNLNYSVYVYPGKNLNNSDHPADYRKKRQLFGPQELLASEDNAGVLVGGSKTSVSMDGSGPQEGATESRPQFGNIKSLLLRVPLWKRIFDIVGATIALATFAPVFVVVAIYIKCVSTGPVFFKQARIGYGGGVFLIWKFRTMHTDADQGSHQQLIGDLLKNNDQPMKKLAKDPRIIPLGNFLRKFCIDELPQLINVLMGEMSLVGPRPDPVYAIDNYHHWYTNRFDALPGITGLWQVSGKNRLSFQQMMRLDIAYAQKRSIWLDLKILFNTVPAILSNAKYDA